MWRHIRQWFLANRHLPPLRPPQHADVASAKGAYLEQQVQATRLQRARAYLDRRGLDIKPLRAGGSPR
jgi:hypothetical protein